MTIGKKKWRDVMKYKEIIEKCNPSQQHEELNDLLIELEKISIKNVLEIGVHRGGSLGVWDEALKPEILVGIDTQILPEANEVKKAILIEGKSQSKEVFSDVQKILNSDYKKRYFDFLFIDGSHYLDDVLEDFKMYKELVREGGIIAFHDVIIRGNDTCEVHRAWELIKKDYKTKTISYKDKVGPTATGCGVVYL